MDVYVRVRRAVLVEGKSRPAVAREFGLARKTVRKMLEYSLPPGYRRQKPIRRPKLGPWLGVIDAILEEDKQRSRKQRHAAKRIFERLRAEHSYTGGYTIVKDYVRQAKLGSQEMFVPLRYAPGEAQADFGQAEVVIVGVERTAHFMAFDLPYSDDCFLQAFPAETTEAFLEGHVRAFAYLRTQDGLEQGSADLICAPSHKPAPITCIPLTWFYLHKLARRALRANVQVPMRRLEQCALR